VGGVRAGRGGVRKRLSGCLLSDPSGVILIPLPSIEGGLPSRQAAAAGQRIIGSQTGAVAARRGRPATAGAHCCWSLTRGRAAGHAVPAVDSAVHLSRSPQLRAEGMVLVNNSTITVPSVRINPAQVRPEWQTTPRATCSTCSRTPVVRL